MKLQGKRLSPMAEALSAEEIAFLKASSTGHYWRIEQLVNSGGLRKPFDSIAFPGGKNPLHLAEGGHVMVCRILLDELMFNIDIVDQEGRTPLFNAVARNREDVVEYLMDRGATIGWRDVKNLTVVHYAAGRGDAGMLDTLLFRGRNGAEDLHPVLNSVPMPVPVKAVLYIVTPLMLAIMSNAHGCIRKLLEAGSDPNIVINGFTPLKVASGCGDFETVQALLYHGADHMAVDSFGRNALECAVWHKNVDAVKALFRITPRIPGYPHWNPKSIMRHARHPHNIRALQQGYQFLAKPNYILRTRNRDPCYRYYHKVRNLVWTMIHIFDLVTVDNSWHFIADQVTLSQATLDQAWYYIEHGMLP